MQPTLASTPATLANRQNNFDLIRLLGALCIRISHSYGLLDKGHQQWAFYISDEEMILGTFGMYAFFTMSGYLVVQSFINSKSYGQYFLKRALRLLPGLMLVNLVVLLACATVTDLPVKDYFLNWQTWRYWFVNSSLVRLQDALPGVFTHMQTPEINGVLWALLLEVKLYVVIAVLSLLTLLRRKWVLLALAVPLLILKTESHFWHYYVPPRSPFDIVLGYSIYFYLGMLFYFFQNYLRFNIWMVTSGLLLLFLVKINMWQSVWFPFVFVYLLLNAGRAKPLFNFGRIDISYGIFLYAFPIQQFIIYFAGSSIPVWLHLLLTMCITVPLAWLSWKYIEYPCLKLKRYFTRKPAVPTLANNAG